MSKEDLTQSENIAVLHTEMKQVFKKLECLSKKIDKFDNKLDNVVHSFNQDKQHIKTYVDNTFATKKEIEPIKSLFKKGKDKLATVGAAVIIFLMLVGAASIGGLDFLKTKIFHFLR